MPSTELLDDPLLANVPVVEGHKVLGGVALYQKLGQGGMGAVYKGRHVRLDIDVALKVMVPPAGISPEHADVYQKRFIREARMAAKIDHPNLVRVTDVNTESGVYFLVMQYVDGESAADRLKRKGALPEAEAVQIVLGAAEGLAAAHEAGIVHRDVKPDNIMIDKKGNVKVADLGLAKAFHVDDDGEQSMLTRTQQAMGTPAFMSPEQIEDFKHVGPPTDVWSLGITLYQLLTEQLPFAESQIHRLFSKICDEPMPEIKELRPELSDCVCGFIEKATRKDPAERYADCGEMTAALRDHQQSAAQPKPTLDDFSAADFHRGTPQASPPPEESLIVIASQLDSSSSSTSESARDVSDEPPAAREKEEVVESLIPEYELQPLFQAPNEKEEDEVEERSSTALGETRPTLSTVASARKISDVVGIGAIVVGVVFAGLFGLLGPVLGVLIFLFCFFCFGITNMGSIIINTIRKKPTQRFDLDFTGMYLFALLGGIIHFTCNDKSDQNRAVEKEGQRRMDQIRPQGSEAAGGGGPHETLVHERPLFDPEFGPPITEGDPSSPPEISKPKQEDDAVSDSLPKPDAMLGDDDAYYYYSQGNVKNSNGDYEGAIADYGKAIELKPDYADAYNQRGYIKILNSTTRDFLAAVLKELVTARIRPFESREGLDTLFDHEGCKCFFTLMLRDPCRRNSVVLLRLKITRAPLPTSPRQLSSGQKTPAPTFFVALPRNTSEITKAPSPTISESL